MGLLRDTRSCGYSLHDFVIGLIKAGSGEGGGGGRRGRGKGAHNPGFISPKPYKP